MATKETIEAIDGVLSLAELVEAVAKDGVTLDDALAAINALRKLPSAIAGAAEIPNEVKGWNDADRAEVKLFIAEEFDLENDGIEVIVEQVLSVAVDLSKLLANLRARNAKQEV